jgi:hypothetical protein
MRHIYAHMYIFISSYTHSFLLADSTIHVFTHTVNIHTLVHAQNPHTQTHTQTHTHTTSLTDSECVQMCTCASYTWK